MRRRAAVDGRSLAGNTRSTRNTRYARYARTTRRLPRPPFRPNRPIGAAARRTSGLRFARRRAGRLAARRLRGPLRIADHAPRGRRGARKALRRGFLLAERACFTGLAGGAPVRLRITQQTFAQLLQLLLRIGLVRVGGLFGNIRHSVAL
ncbi:hypothetical protein BG61_07095 [Caballeronia glathei]|uniref:Uncharacterized protein n=1 Tax=Caballeronia glathei TaxID=60547 RepID=A0A069PAW8_9BURK|nr:hypothetical protein BG61_07095 [Caballeronia glathei]